MKKKKKNATSKTSKRIKPKAKKGVNSSRNKKAPKKRVSKTIPEKSKVKSKAKRLKAKEQRDKILRGKIKYQKSKLNDLVNHIEKIRDKPLKQKIQFEGKKKSVKTVLNILLNRSTQVNNNLSEKESKLKNYRPRRKKFKVRTFKVDNTEDLENKIGLADTEIVEYYFAWNYSDAVESILSDIEVDYFNGLSVKKDSDLIMDYLFNVFENMRSRDIFTVIKNITTYHAYSFVITDNEEVFAELRY